METSNVFESTETSNVDSTIVEANSFVEVSKDTLEEASNSADASTKNNNKTSTVTIAVLTLAVASLTVARVKKSKTSQ